jgi:hypothetical protein
LRTPKEFINNVVVAAETYSKDSATILSDLYYKMKKHEASFANPEYFDSTMLFVDTIIYDSSLSKIAVFVVAKNPTYRNPHSQSKFPFYYNANCYLGKRLNLDTNELELKCLCRFSEINFDDRETVIKALKEDFFYRLAVVKDENKQPLFKYNLDDRRFWVSPTGWKRAFPE